MFDINKEKNKSNPQRAPLKREAPVPLRTPVVRRRKPVQPGKTPLSDLFKDRKGMSFDQNTGFHGGPSARRKGYRLALWSWLASFIDALILVATSCVFLVMFSYLMKTSVGGIIASLTHGQHRLLLFAEVYALSSWIYMIAIRSFMGSSIGEWACDLRLGQPHERFENTYVLKVILRSTLVLTTGMVTLPFLSLIIGKDVPGICSGLRLFSLK